MSSSENSVTVRHLILSALLLLFLITYLGFSAQLMANGTIPVDVGHLRFSFPVYLTDPANSAWISSSLSFPYYDNRHIIMYETKLSDYPKENDVFDKYADGSTKISTSEGEIITKTTTQLIEPIFGYPSLLTISYSERQYNRKLYHLLRMIIKIKMPEGVVSFHILPDDLDQTNTEEFVEDEKVRFITWVKLFMPNYKWVGNHNQGQVGNYKSQYGLIKYNESNSPINFEIFVNYHDKNSVTDLFIVSNNPWRYEMIRDTLSTFVRACLHDSAANYSFKGARLRQIKGRRGVEIVFAVKHYTTFYWFELKPLGDAHYTSFDISGGVSFPLFQSSKPKDAMPDPLVLWNQIVNAL